MTKLIDIYFSPSLHDYQMNSETWMVEHDEMMPMIKINGEYVPFSERIEHGKKPFTNKDDLILIGTLLDSEIDVQVVRKW